MDFAGVSNMRATDWCISRVTDVAERIAYRIQGLVRMVEWAKVRLSMGRIDDFVDQHLQSYQQRRPEFENNRYCFALIFFIVSCLVRTKTINGKQ